MSEMQVGELSVVAEYALTPERVRPSMNHSKSRKY